MNFASAWRRRVVEGHRGRQGCVCWQAGLGLPRRGWRSRSEKSEPTGSELKSDSSGRVEGDHAEAGAGASSRCTSECGVDGRKKRSSPGGSNTHDREAERRNRRKEPGRDKKRRRQGRKRVYTVLVMKIDDSGWLECGDCTARGTTSALPTAVGMTDFGSCMVKLW